MTDIKRKRQMDRPSCGRSETLNCHFMAEKIQSIPNRMTAKRLIDFKILLKSRNNLRKQALTMLV